MLYLMLNFTIQLDAQTVNVLKIPYLSVKPTIDGNLDDWKEQAYTDGIWDLDRVQESHWYNPKRNKITVHEGEDTIGIDLRSEYYMAWDDDFLYFGALVSDNVNDVIESKHEPKRWYYKDAVAWFIESPRDTIPEKFMNGNHGFAFIADTTRPEYAAWWRHGTEETPYIEEPLPSDAVEYVVSMINGTSNYCIEAKINADKLLGTEPDFQGLKKGQSYGLMIVHCDPDGGEYGGHLLIYGAGDNDSTWSEMVLDDQQND